LRAATGLTPARSSTLAGQNNKGNGDLWDAEKCTLRKIKKGSNCVEPFLFTAKFLVGRAGLEPATNGLKVRCSTN
jgi:hypothetical protein